MWTRSRVRWKSRHGPLLNFHISSSRPGHRSAKAESSSTWIRDEKVDRERKRRVGPDINLPLGASRPTRQSEAFYCLPLEQLGSRTLHPRNRGLLHLVDGAVTVLFACPKTRKSTSRSMVRNDLFYSRERLRNLGGPAWDGSFSFDQRFAVHCGIRSHSSARDLLAFLLRRKI
jgi:hypothetical protein